MDVLIKKWPLFILLVLFFSCSKLTYIVEQGTGQIKLLSSAKNNEKILNDVKRSQSDRNKIRKIIEFKSFFYNYFNKKSTSIYNKTTFLDQNAVTYLVISSPFNQVSPIEECFPFLGCFPYLGFFKEESAKEYSLKQENRDLMTYIRPVYAYSSLGYFDDPILSSFFYYEDYDLAELIFHELFHTIFFVKNEVVLNENLANFFGEELTFHYFKFDEKKKIKRREKKEKYDELNLAIVDLVKQLDQEYKKSNPKDKKQAKLILSNFLEKTFFVTIKEKCNFLGLSIDECFPLKREWNNASFSEFLTYEKEGKRIRDLYAEMGNDLKKLLEFIEKSYGEFQDETPKISFRDRLLAD